MKLTPVLIVEEIEKSLPFWMDRMGFAKTVEVPDAERLGFVILARDGAEVMLQSLASAEKDEPKFAGVNRTALFIEVDDFEDVRKRLDGYPVVMNERTTFYGMREIGVFEPNGNTVVFAAKL